MLRRNTYKYGNNKNIWNDKNWKIKNIIFATVDKSPHCVQVHYIRNELEKMMNLNNINIVNYVVVNDELIEIDSNLISLSKSLTKLKNISK